ncbi:hypothetical protein RBB78_00700 [Tunturiibacter empetritectus]|uniref:hypothetical protein n=1 Tax=Tunturiibacter empetritectus TaxID=3069691 RepID=UPI003D9BD898
MGLLQVFCVFTSTFAISLGTRYPTALHWLHAYMELTGTDSTFKFFAPHVASQAIAEVTSYSSGAVTHFTRYRRVRNDVDFRIIAFSLGLMQKQRYTLLGYALAEDAIKTDPAVDRVEVKLGFWQVRPLRESKTQSPQFLVLYRGDYARTGIGP